LDELQGLLGINEMETLDCENEFNTIIKERLIEMERKFPSLPHEEEHFQEEAEVFTKTLKQVLASYMNMLKVKP